MRCLKHRSGFTLVELLLVAAIIAIVTVVVVPSMVKSIKGNRMRVATKTVVTAGKYARSMAVLKQKEMAVIFDIERSSVKIMPVKRDLAAPTNGVAAAAADGLTGAGNPDQSEPAVTDDKISTGFTGENEIERELDLVSIISVDAGGEDQSKGICTIIYSNNGRCAPYKVRLQDEDGNINEIKVDALGSAETSKM
jgi:type II secretion system protein H